jgi:hypothetical protein
MLYRLISAEKARTPISIACELLGVSRSGYYAWATRAPSDRALSDAWLVEKIQNIHNDNSRSTDWDRGGCRRNSVSATASSSPASASSG